MRDFLIELLKTYPYIPPHAFWRSIEAKLLCDEPFKPPILDLGCGDGLFARILFKDKNLEIIGCDVSRECVAKAKSCGVYKSVNIADGHHLLYKNNSFATVLANCVLEHIPEDEMVLKEVSRVLRKGGKFIFTVPSENFIRNLKTQDVKYVESFNKRLEIFHYRSPQEWKKLLQRYDLTPEKIRYFLPKRVQQLWEKLTQFFIIKVMGKELHTLLGLSKKVGIGYILQIVFPVVFSRYLRKWYPMGTLDSKDGGGLLIVARK